MSTATFRPPVLVRTSSGQNVIVRGMTVQPLRQVHRAPEPSYAPVARPPVPPKQPARPAQRESAETTLAKNLLVARVSAGLTQHALAAAAGVSRATVAQIETGCGDPRLSTIAGLAEAIGIPPILLLLGELEVDALSSLSDAEPEANPDVPVADLERIHRLVASGMLKDRVRAGRAGGEAVRQAGLGSSAATAAAIFTPIRPGAGTQLGARLGQALGRAQSGAEASAVTSK